MRVLLLIKRCILEFHLQESFTQRSSPLVYCLPLVRKFILIGMSLFGRSTTLKTCFPVHNFTGCSEMKRLLQHDTHIIIIIITVEALLRDTLLSGQLYLRPPCLKPRLNSLIKSVFLQSRRPPRTLSEITT